MSSVVIFKKDLSYLGKILMKEFYYQIHEDYFLKEFEEVRLKRKYYDENLTKEFLSFYKSKERKENIESLYFNYKKSLKELVQMETKDLLSKIEAKILDETLNVDIIFNFFEQMDINLELNKNIDFEIDEDLFCMKKKFINIYNVFNYDYKELELVKQYKDLKLLEG